MDVPLVCYACGSTATIGDGEQCDCGEPYWVDTDPEEFAWPEGREGSIWRYRDLLPVDPPTGVGASVGGTPLVRAPRLDDDAGARVHVKFEGAHPTGTFKDRGSAVGVAGALAADADAVGTVSHGNMARSVAAHAASEGVDCVVLVPADIPTERLELIARHDPTILRVEGSYGDLYHEALRVGREHDVAFVNSDTPLRVAGQKTTGLEIAESFAPDAPDAVVMPVSSGGHASGVWKAFRELDAAGLIDEVPRLYLTQAAPCSPIAEAYEAGRDEVESVDGEETVCYSIGNDDPPSGTRALVAARETGGAVVAVPDEETLDARGALASEAGLFVETSCATPLAGARRLAARGAFAPDEDVVLVATGTGYTERSIDPPTVDAPTVSMDELGEAVRGAVAGNGRFR